jgi:hypothetical protein
MIDVSKRGSPMPLSRTHQRLLASALLAVSATQAQSQTQTQNLAAPTAGRADPMNAQAEVPAVMHQSAFATFRAVGDGQVGNWQEANRTVARIGGWRAYAREAAVPVPAPAVRSPAAHHGHGQP